MSTKCSIAYGDDFHIYEDMADDEPEPIYLEFNQVVSCDVHHRVYDGESHIATTVVIERKLWQRILKSLKERGNLP